MSLFDETVISMWSREGFPATITARWELTSCIPTVWSSHNALGAQRCSQDNTRCVSFAILAVATGNYILQECNPMWFRGRVTNRPRTTLHALIPERYQVSGNYWNLPCKSTDWIKGTRGSKVGFCQQGDEPSASIRHTKFQSLTTTGFSRTTLHGLSKHTCFAAYRN